MGRKGDSAVGRGNGMCKGPEKGRGWSLGGSDLKLVWWHGESEKPGRAGHKKPRGLTWASVDYE